MTNWRITVAAIVGTIAAIGSAEAITDTAFIYSTAKTGDYTINPGDLAPAQNGAAYTNSPNDLHLTANTGVCFQSGVHLPQGATITQITLWHSSGAGSDMFVTVDRVGLATGLIDTVVSASMHDDSNTRKQVNFTPHTGVTVVNNNSFRYTFVVCPETIDNTFFGARFAYTYKNAGD